MSVLFVAWKNCTLKLGCLSLLREKYAPRIQVLLLSAQWVGAGAARGCQGAAVGGGPGGGVGGGAARARGLPGVRSGAAAPNRGPPCGGTLPLS